MIALRYVVWIVLALSVTSLYAESPLELPTSFQAKFEQSITSDSNKKISYKGSIGYSQRHFKWSYVLPTKKDVCSDGKKLLVVDHDLEQASRYRVDDGLDLSSILKRAKFHRKSVYIASYQGKNYTIQVDKQKRLRRIAYRDNLDNNVLIVFKNIQYSNREISAKGLRCSVPSNYDQIGD